MTELEHPEYETTPELRTELDYEGYRALMDEVSTAFRETGIVDALGYNRAMRDGRTVKIRVGDTLLPLLAPIEHVSGYDVERTRTLVGQKNVYVLSAPIELLGSPDSEVIMPEEEGVEPGAFAIVAETDHAATDDAKMVLPELLAEIGTYTPQRFLDTRIADPEGQAAFMGVYGARLVAVDEDGELIPHRSSDFYGTYENLVAEGYPLTEHTKLLDVHSLRDNEALVDELWDLCEDRFEWLGEGHPVSMEDTKDFFVQVILSEDTHTLVRYDDDGKPACLGFFISGLDECGWLSKKFRDSVTNGAMERDDRVLYFHGIASNSEGSAHYARDVVQLLSRITKEMGGAYLLIFESTNMSSQYIPKIVTYYIKESDGLTIDEPMHEIAQVDYWYIAPKPSATSG